MYGIQLHVEMQTNPVQKSQHRLKAVSLIRAQGNAALFLFHEFLQSSQLGGRIAGPHQVGRHGVITFLVNEQTL